MKKKELLKRLKKRCTYSKKINLPAKIDFYLKNNVLSLVMSEECVVENMQENNAAFEGWSVTVFRWLKEDLDIEKIILKWAEPDNLDNQHYQRFLYRVKNFNNMYSWFEIEKPQYLNHLKLKFNSKNNYYINVPGKREIEENKNQLDNEKNVESVLAAAGINTESKKILKKENLSFQLPVGVFDKKPIKNKNRIFPGGKSAIDLFGVESDTTYIFELKVNSKMVGILTQIYFYSMIVKDIQQNNLKPAEKNDSIEKIRATDKLSAYMIADEFHPLIDNKVLDIMNEGIEEIEFKALNFILNKFSLSYFDRK